MTIASTTQKVSNQPPNNRNAHQNTVEDDDMLQTQIRLNTKALEDVVNLQKQVEKASKEREFYKTRLAEANKILEKLKSNGKKEDGGKEVNDEKKGAEGEKENIDPMNLIN